MYDFEKFCVQNPGKTHVVYKGTVYDVTEFLGDHPGGPSFILDFKNEDITTVLHSPAYHEHSDTALRMLYKYKIGAIISDREPLTNKKTDTQEAYPKITETTIEYNGFTIDRTRGMVMQICKLNKKQYMHMIHNAIHLPYCRLFDGEFFESGSRNPWYRIPIFWTPWCLYLMYYGMTYDYPKHSFADDYLLIASTTFSLLGVILSIFLGIFVWSFTEYLLHRGIFHFDDPLPDHPFFLWLHFIIHGIHHTIPMDPDRLVFPPTLGVIVFSMIFPILTSLFPGNLGRLVSVGFLIGYVCYDMTHIYIHHGTPWIQHFKEMKKYHNKHHYLDGNKGYGITTKIWDKVFGTELM
jgi:sterol desaturase/sphingolipid hydroxylase (fatty acid hydroxylase superfamily)